MASKKLLNEMTLRKLERTLSRQKEAMAETEHHIELVTEAIAQQEREERPNEPRLPLDHPNEHNPKTTPTPPGSKQKG